MESPFKAEILKGKVALITGGGSGIGFEISTQFGKHGASIAIMGRRKQVLDSAVSALHSLGIPVLFVFSFFSSICAISLPFPKGSSFSIWVLFFLFIFLRICFALEKIDLMITKSSS